MKLSKKLILASKSPRRKEILTQAGIDFEIRTLDTDEIYPEDMPLQQVPEYLAKLKANALKHSLADDEVILSADTIVLLKNTIFGKPKDFDDAVAILKSLSGATHEVISGVCMMTNHKTITFTDVTKVTFKELKLADIHYYINTFQPFDKAGAYAIQEWIGLIGISKIEGNYYNIVGLPIHKVIEELRAYEI
jgi:septum formation protein